MYNHILIPTDGSDFANKGVEHGLALARKLGTRVSVLTVTEPYPLYATSAHEAWAPVNLDKYEAAQKAFARGVLDKVAEAARKLGLTAETVHVSKQVPSETIVRTAEERGCDLIVIASHGRRGLARLLIGSQTAEVLHESKVPVLVVRN